MVFELHAEFSSRACPIQLNGLFVNSKVRGKIERKDCDAVDMEFTIIGGFIDKEKGVKIVQA